jgi:hypothetical protein
VVELPDDDLPPAVLVSSVKIYVIDLDDNRLRVAKQIGATVIDRSDGKAAVRTSAGIFPLLFAEIRVVTAECRDALSNRPDLFGRMSVLFDIDLAFARLLL